MANVSSFSGAMPVIPGGLVELGYSQITSNVTITSNTAGSGTEIIAPLTVVCDGSPVLVEFWCGQTIISTGSQISLSLYRDGAEVHRQWAVAYNGTINADYPLMCASFRTTPSAGSHTFGVKAYGPSSPQMLATGTNNAPIFLRVSKIVSQNDGLKPFWKPPIVTQLPTLAQVGDQVVYAADATNGVYWLLQYDGLGTYPWKFIGGAPLTAQVDTDENIVAGTITYTALATAGPSITLALAGDYVISQGLRAYPFATNQGCRMSYDIGATSASDNDSVLLDCAAGFGENGSRTRLKTGIAASTAIVSKYRHTTTGAGANFQDRWMSITPVRVKAA